MQDLEVQSGTRLRSGRKRRKKSTSEASRGGGLGEAIARGQGSPFRVASEASRERTRERRGGKEGGRLPFPFPVHSSARLARRFFYCSTPLFHFFPALQSLVLSYWKKCRSTQRRKYYFEMLSSSSQVQSKHSDKIFRNVRSGLDIRSHQQLIPRKYFSQSSSRQQRENLL